MIDFLLLTKHDFIRECLLKENMFGKVFENHDCPELRKIFLNAIMLLQSFNDDFTFVRGENGVPSGKWQTKLERRLQLIPPCELIKLRLIMVSFVHKKILNRFQFKKHVDMNSIYSGIYIYIYIYIYILVAMYFFMID